MSTSPCNNDWNKKSSSSEKDIKILLSDLCRLCGNASGDLIPIFEGEGFENNLGVKIEKHLPFHVLEDDNFPQKVCLHCARTVLSWHDITENILRVEKKFRNILRDMGVYKDFHHATEVAGIAAFEFSDNEKETSYNNAIAEINVPSGNEITRSQAQESEFTSPDMAENNTIAAPFTLFEQQNVQEVESLEDNIFSSPVVSCDSNTILPTTRYFSVQDTQSDNSGFPFNVQTTESSVSSVFCQIQNIHNPHTVVPYKNYIMCVLGEHSSDASELQKLDHDYIFQDIGSETLGVNVSVCNNKTIEFPSVQQIDPSIFWSTNWSLCYRIKFRRDLGTGRRAIVHWLPRRKKSVLQCEECLSCFQNAGVLLTHSRLHTRTKLFHCELCGKTFHLHAVLQRHIKLCKEKLNVSLISHNSNKENEMKYNCNICGKTYKLKASLKDHLRKHVGKARCKLKCEVCSAKFLRKAELLGHKQTCHNSVLKCETCNKLFLDDKDLQYHEITHSNLRPFQCDICGLRYKRKSHLTRHLQTHSSNHQNKLSSRKKNNPFHEHKCDVCSKVFRTKSILSMHMVSHTGERKYECVVCGKRFGQSGGLSRHLQTIHGGKKNFFCVICNSRFTAKATLENHKRIHTGEKPFQCTICGKTFRTLQQHKLHERVHSDDRPFPCPHCVKQFKRRPHLIVHMRTHTGEKPFSCPICGRSFTQKNDMTKHLNIHKRTYR